MGGAHARDLEAGELPSRSAHLQPAAAQTPASEPTAYADVQSERGPDQVPKEEHRQHQYVKDIDKRASPAKHLIVCLDGTSNEYGENESNVLRFFELLDQDNQSTYYQPGIGTSAPAGSTLFRWYAPISSSWSVLKWNASKMYDLMFGGSVGTHVQDAYKWVCDEYEPGAKISIVGFSRGSYTARVLAAMILSFGLLDSGMHQAIPKVYDAFMRLGKKNFWNADLKKWVEIDDLESTLASQIRRSASPIDKIHFMGIFDTVAEIGYKGVGNAETSKVLVKNLRWADRVAHALAIDEKRRQFLPMPFESRSEHPEYKNDKIHEAWFAGVHSDIGGGYAHDARDKADLRLSLPKPPDSKGTAETPAAPSKPEATIFRLLWMMVMSLFTQPVEPAVDPENTYRARASNITLRWMVNQASAAGISFAYDAIYGAKSMFEAREELRLVPHESYLHYTHPAGQMQYPAFVQMQADIRALEVAMDADLKALRDTIEKRVNPQGRIDRASVEAVEAAYAIEKVKPTEKAWRRARGVRASFINDKLIPDAAALDCLPVEQLTSQGISWIDVVNDAVASKKDLPHQAGHPQALIWDELQKAVSFSSSPNSPSPSLRHTCVLLDLSTQLHESRDFAYKLIPPWGVGRRVFEAPVEWSKLVRILQKLRLTDRSDFVAPDPNVDSYLHPSVSSRYEYTKGLPTREWSMMDLLPTFLTKVHHLVHYKPAIPKVQKRLDKKETPDVTFPIRTASHSSDVKVLGSYDRPLPQSAMSHVLLSGHNVEAKVPQGKLARKPMPKPTGTTVMAMAAAPAPKPMVMAAAPTLAATVSPQTPSFPLAGPATPRDGSDPPRSPRRPYDYEVVGSRT